LNIIDTIIITSSSGVLIAGALLQVLPLIALMILLLGLQCD